MERPPNELDYDPLPVVVVGIAVLIGVVLYCCCCKGKRATKAPQAEVKMSSTAV